jgi:ABC-type nitrate/sulfonate/bicarbonate transport system substrate-binding protein
LGVVLTVALSACSSSNSKSDSGGKMPSVVFSGVAPNAGNWALQICSDAGIGICQKYGVHMKMIYSASSPAAISALYGGSVQYTSALYTAAIPAYLKNDDLVYVAGGYDFFPYDLVTPNSITSVDQLKGKTCGVQIGPTSGDGPYLQLMISDGSNGALSYPGDYKLVADSGIATLSGAEAAYKAGQVQCSAQVPPNSGLLADSGYHTLLQTKDLPSFQNLPFFGLNTLKSWLSKNSDTNTKFLQGYLASIAWLEDPDNKTAAINLLAKDANTTTEVAESSYEYLTDGGYPRQGTVVSTAISSNLALAQKYGGIDKSVTADQLSGLVDNSYVQKAYAALPESVKCEQYVPEAVTDKTKPDCSKTYKYGS